MTRHPVTRRRTVLALTAATAVVLAACASPDESSDTSTDAGEEMVIGLTYTPDVQFAPFYVAEARGYYEDAGVDVTLRHHGASESLFGALEAGEEDLVVAGGDEMLQARSAGVPVVNVATLYEEYPVVLIVPADSDITSAEDLAGRSVGIPGPFGETYFGLLALLADAGLTEDDLTVEHIGFTQQAALSAGHVDAVMGYANNDAVQFAEAGVDVRTIPLGEVPLVGIGVGTHEDLLADDGGTVAAVVSATMRGVQDVVEDPAAAVDVAAEHVPGLADPAARDAALATVEATVPLYGSASGGNDLARWEAMATFMSETGLLEGEVDVTAAVTNDAVAHP
ncbi:NitT/TauT family transport system substrate-binding protein [Georgenia satyanarayanai]|uniref:NitT/TauT family transport system substrate-binding protein n=1 Tax=Georgenia satyanarayanai TaxID=860221 RepID=A0A2Y9BVD6_9MICO|nr:ABC transporter substrate-binding protein [Georgenia satyanarayanai]PYG02302.1 NitT/TauT family transport system substrate-binding protein [Georgenia satyanarayanai]SSA37162.1 NitT/TauT family transport system substrate-binding protein [Georgenia satyanarayanai]